MPGKTSRKKTLAPEQTVPDVTDLIRKGAKKPEDIDPDLGIPKHPGSPTITLPNGETVSGGYVPRAEGDPWRMGLSPEKYFEKLKQETMIREFENRYEQVAPTLYDPEKLAFAKWLAEKVKDEPDIDLPNHPIIQSIMKVNDRKKKDA